MEALEHDFAQIVREHKGTIYTVCYMFSQNEDEVADLFQDILVNLWNGFRKFRGDSSHNTWIYRVSLNTCISAERKKKRKGETIPLDMNINLFDDSGILVRISSRYVCFRSGSAAWDHSIGQSFFFGWKI